MLCLLEDFNLLILFAKVYTRYKTYVYGCVVTS